MKNKFSLNSAIPTHVAFVVIMLAGLTIAIFTIKVGERIIKNTEGTATKRDVEIEKQLKAI